MTITERARQTLFNRLDEKLGHEEAETMMELLPHQGWSDVARTGDIEILRGEIGVVRDALNDRITAESALLRSEIADVRAELKTDIADLRTELKTDIADLRTELADVRAELKTDIADLRTELKTDIADLRSELKTELAASVVSLADQIHQENRALQRRIILLLAATMLTMILTSVSLA